LRASEQGESGKVAFVHGVQSGWDTSPKLTHGAREDVSRLTRACPLGMHKELAIALVAEDRALDAAAPESLEM